VRCPIGGNSVKLSQAVGIITLKCVTCPTAYGTLGRRIRKVIPACGVKIIRQKFPKLAGMNSAFTTMMEVMTMRLWHDGDTEFGCETACGGVWDYHDS